MVHCRIFYDNPSWSCKVEKVQEQYREVEGPFDFFASWFDTVRVAMEENAHAALWINKMGYNTYCQVARN